MKKKRKTLRISALLIAATLLPWLLCSCQWITAGTSDEEIEDLEKDMRGTKRTTIFEESLHKFGALLRAYNVPKTPIQSKNIGNLTAGKDVPQDIYIMIASTIGKIGSPIIFVPYDAQYVVAEATTGGNISRLYPKVVITGGITGFDKDMIEKKRKGSASGGWAGATGGARYSADGAVSRVTLDLSIMDYHTQSYFPGVLTSNALLLRKMGYTWGIHGYYMGNGAAFDSGYKEKEGVHAGLRTLVELSVIELLGRYFEVPYWTCTKGVTRDNEMVAAMKIRFLNLPLEEQLKKVKHVLFLDGVDDLNFTTPGADADEEKIIQYCMKNKGVSNLWSLYEKVWEELPIEMALSRARLARRKAKRLLEEQKIEAAQRAEVQRRKEEEARQARVSLINNYKEQIARADALYSKGNTTEALKAYGAARMLIPQEQHALQMINRIKAQQAQTLARQQQYKQLVANADSRFNEVQSQSFNRANYNAVLAMYRQAATINHNDQHVKDKINEVNKAMSKYSSFINPGQEVKW